MPDTEPTLSHIERIEWNKGKPRKDPDDDTIDEIVALDGHFHIEQMSEDSYWMRIGDDNFSLQADAGRLLFTFDWSYDKTERHPDRYDDAVGR